MAAYFDIDYEKFMSLTPAIFNIIIEQKNQKLIDQINFNNNYFGQVCSTIANSAGSKKRWKASDFFSNKNDRIEKDNNKCQTADEMALMLTALTKELGGDIIG